MNFLPEQCTKCYIVPDDILMLSCVHDLCLECASECYGVQQASLEQRTYTIYCDICGSITLLESESVEKLENLFMSRQTISKRKALNMRINKLLKQSVQQQTVSNKNSKCHEKENKSFNNVSARLSTKSQISSKPESSKFFCHEHKDEVISYFCFDCKSNCICSECVIHGDHKNHNVKTVKKAYPHIKTKIQEILEKTKSAQKVIDEQREEIQQRQDSQNQFIAKIKIQIEKEFEIQDLKLFLEKKQNEIIDQISKIPEVTTHYESFLSNIYSVQQDVQKLNYEIQQHLEGQDHITTLNFYSNLCQSTLPEIIPLSDHKDLQFNTSDLFVILKDIKQSLNKYTFQDKKVDQNKKIMIQIEDKDTFVQTVVDSVNYNLSKSSQQSQDIPQKYRKVK